MTQNGLNLPDRLAWKTADAPVEIGLTKHDDSDLIARRFE